MAEILSKIGWEIGKKIGTEFDGYLKNKISHKKLVDNILENLSDYLTKEGKTYDTERIANNIRDFLEKNPMDVKLAGENFQQPHVLATEFLEKVLIDEQLNEPDLVRGAIETLFQEFVTHRDIFDQIYPKVLQSMSKASHDNKGNYLMLSQILEILIRMEQGGKGTHVILRQILEILSRLEKFGKDKGHEEFDGQGESNNQGKPDRIWYSDISRADTGFFGREDELKQIGAKLANGGSVLLVGGAGGIGKTALAVEWFYSCTGAYVHRIALKVTEGLSAALLNAPILRNDLGLPDSSEGIVEQFAATLNKLDGQNLLLLDDIRNDLAKDLEIISQLKPNWTKLFTSRERVGQIPAMTLDVLKPEDATKLFKQIFYSDRDFAKTDEQQADTRKLLEIVGYHALGVKLFARAGSEAGLSLADMLNAGLGAKAVLNFEHDSEQSATDLMNYYRETFKPQDWPENLREVLKQFSFLPDGFLPDADIRELFPEQMTDLADLARKGLVESGSGKWRMHAVIRAFVREEFAPGFDDSRGFLERMLSLFEYDDQIPEHNFRDKVRWIEYARSASEVLLNDSEALDFIDRTARLFYYAGFFNDSKIFYETCLEIALCHGDVNRISRQRNELANVLGDLGDFAGAKGQLELALESDLKNLGQDHPIFTVRRSNLANVLGDLGDYAGAREQLELALENDLENLGSDHPNIATYRSNLANVLRNLGDYAGAKEQLELALESDLKNFGQDHPIVTVRRSNLANVLGDLGDYAGARAQLELSLESDLKTLGPDHPHIATYRSNLGQVLQNLGDNVGAREQLELALESDLKNLGPDHPHVADCRSNLAKVLGNFRDYAGAKVQLELALESELRIFSSEHPTIAVTRSNLASVLHHLGDNAGAKDQLELALGSGLKIFGLDHPNVSTYRSNLAIALRNLGDNAGAREQLELSLESDLKNLGPDHPIVTVRRSNLANVLGDLGDYAGAKKQLELALESDLKNLGRDHPEVAIRRSNLGEVLRLLGDYARAKEQLELALKSELRIFSSEHPTIAVTRSNLGLVLKDLGDYAEAKVQLELALESGLKNLGPVHPEVAVRRSNLASVLLVLGDYAGAKEQLELSLESDLRNLGPDHPNVATRYNNLGNVHKSADEINEAETCFRKALEIWQKTLPPEHPHILQVEESLLIVQSKKQ